MVKIIQLWERAVSLHDFLSENKHQRIEYPDRIEFIFEETGEKMIFKNGSVIWTIQN